MPNEPLWVEIDSVLEAHKEQIERFGGPEGVRDIGLIESAIERPKTLFHYEGETDVLALAVRLGLGIAKNHGFVDGNKRTGAIAMLEFLAINGYVVKLPNDTTLGVLFEAAVAGKMTEQELADDLYPHIEAF